MKSRLRRLPAVLFALAVVLLISGACSSTTPTETSNTAADAQVAATAGHDHDDLAVTEVDPNNPPTVTLTVHQDAMSGWNLEIGLTNFRLSPEHASGAAVAGEGHMHLYVDGVKQARLYGEWWHLASLAPGSHLIEVEVNGNDHSPLIVDSAPVRASATIEVDASGDSADVMAMNGDAEVHEMDHPDSAAEHVVVADYAAGQVTVDANRVKVDKDSTVEIKITSDVAEEIHVHGYDDTLELMPGMAQSVTFTADVAGIFEVELEHSGTFLFELEVQ